MILAHTLTYPELAKAKEGVMNLQGVMIGGPDRKTDDPRNMWLNWQRAVQDAARKPGVVPKNVMEYFQATKHLTKPPASGDLAITQDRPINPTLIIEEPEIIMSKPFTPPRFTWSYTSMNEFLTCPAQWAAEKYYKTVPYVESEAMRWGNVVHKALENAVLGKATPMDAKVISDGGYAKYIQALEKAKAGGAEIHVEKEMCFTDKLKFCGWWDNNIVWYRGKADVLIINGNKLTVWDYKTGAVKPDLLQLRMMCAFAALYFPQVEIFDGKLLFLAHDKIEGLEKPLLRTDLKPILAEVLGVVRRMEAAWESQNFPCKKNGLCRNYCAHTECPHCGG